MIGTLCTCIRSILTTSTGRFKQGYLLSPADRAKQIKTTASVNEDPTEKLIRELSEENERLKKMLESGSVQVPSGDGEDGIEAEEGMSEEGKKQ